jgi:protoporphyrinogen IX oxidase
MRSGARNERGRQEFVLHMLWLKAFHIVFVVTWFAGLFYLPRLFVYHASASDEAGRERFKLMERKLFVMMTIGFALAAAFGVAMLFRAPALMSAGWLQLKFALVALLAGYHIWCFRLMLSFRADANRHSERWFRLFNEAPSLLLIAIVLLAVLKPF